MPDAALLEQPHQLWWGGGGACTLQNLTSEFGDVYLRSLQGLAKSSVFKGFGREGKGIRSLFETVNPWTHSAPGSLRSVSLSRLWCITPSRSPYQCCLPFFHLLNQSHLPAAFYFSHSTPLALNALMTSLSLDASHLDQPLHVTNQILGTVRAASAPLSLPNQAIKRTSC